MPPVAGSTRAGGLLVVVQLALVLAGAGYSQTVPRSTLEVPSPDLGSMEATAREKLESMQAALQRLTAEPEVPESDLAEGFGYLGQLFQAFQLFDAAEICYLNAQSLRGEDHRWPYYLGLVRNSSGDFAEAVGAYERALALRPDDVAIRLRLGNALLELNRDSDAQRHFARVLELDSSSAAAHFGLGQVAVIRGDLSSAVASFERALAEEPAATVIHYPLAQAYRKLGDDERARHHLGQRGEERPSFPDPLGDQVSRLAKGTAFEVTLALARDDERFSAADFLGFALSQFGDVKGAIEQLEHGLALQREEGSEATTVERARIHYVLGGLLVNDGRDERAIDHFAAAVELDTTLLDARVKWGNCLARAQRYAEAAERYGEVLAVDPDHGDALLKRAAALMAAERGGEARPDLERLVELEPDHSEARLRLAAVLVGAGELELAIPHLRSALDLDLSPPTRAQAHTQLARLLRRQGAVGEAHDQFKLALEADPEAIPPREGLASLLGQTGRYSEAAEQYRIIVAQQPENVGAWVGEATALILDGKYAAAAERLEQGLRALPTQLTLKDILARHLAACPDLTVRNGARALVLARELFDELPTPESVETLAMAHAQAGQFEDAVSWQQRLITAAEEAGETDGVERLRRNLERYRSRQACCAQP